LGKKRFYRIGKGTTSKRQGGKLRRGGGKKLSLKAKRDGKALDRRKKYRALKRG